MVEQKAAAALAAMSPEDQVTALAAMPPEDRAAALAAMSPEDQAAALAAMSPEDRATALAAGIGLQHAPAEGEEPAPSHLGRSPSQRTFTENIWITAIANIDIILEDVTVVLALCECV